MRKFHLLFYCLLFFAVSYAQEYEYNYCFFTNSLMHGEYFFSHTTSQHGSIIEASGNKLPVCETHFHTPGNSLKMQYQNAAEGNWIAAIYHPEKRGMDHFKPARFLSFWIFTVTNHDLPTIQLMKTDSSLTASISMPVSKLNEWQQLIVPLTAFNDVDVLKPENSIAVVFSQGQKTACNQNIVYIDDIEFLSEENPPLISEIPVLTEAKGFAKHVDVKWEKPADNNIHLVNIYRSEDGKTYQAIGIQQNYINRYTDFTGETGKKYFYKISFLNSHYQESAVSSPVSAATQPMSDDELLTMVQEASFRYYWEASEKNSGLAKENIPGRQNMIATGASGFGIMALIVATERKFISRQESMARFIKIVTFLEKAETFHGVFPHFLDGRTAKAEPFFGNRDNGADLVETSFLLQGLLAALQYFSGNTEEEQLIRKKITLIWEKAEWDWFRQYPNSKFLYWHWSPDQAWIINHPLIGWNETMVSYLLAIASPTHSVPASMYYSGWANQDSTGQQYRSAWGQTADGCMYTNGKSYFGVKLDVGVSNGGPLFFTHYSYMGFDPHFITDKYTNYFTNNQNIAKINYAYCLQNLKHYKGYGEGAWGLTASDGPFNYSADAPVPWQDYGKIAPTGAVSSFPYLPEESMKALKNYYYNYGKFLWGEYGFRDAFDLTNNWCSEIYMGLNQAPQVVMIENYRTGLLWNLFMQNPEIQKGLKKIQDENK